ncbi:MAG: sugar ABC transporter permease [Caldilineaceae bacterium]|nr:sugar ABC transporter permease [Caldilineaceae bacterium]
MLRNAQTQPLSTPGRTQQPARFAYLRKAGRDIRMNKGLYLLILPPLVYVILFHYVPMYGLIIAFQDFSFRRGYLASDWVGLEHFRWLMDNPNFVRAFFNTLQINFLRIVLGFPAPIILAILINEVRLTYYKRTVQTLSYLPFFISWVVLAGVFNDILARDYGALNNLLAALGLTRVDFLQDEAVFPITLILSEIWRTIGWGSIIYLATIATISPTLYEAAEVDGATRYHKIRFITLPALYPVMVVVLLLNIGNVLRVGFDQVFNLYNPLVYETGDIIQTFIVRSFEKTPDFSRLAAAGFVQSFLGVLFLLIANQTVKYFRDGEGLF